MCRRSAEIVAILSVADSGTFACMMTKIGPFKFNSEQHDKAWHDRAGFVRWFAARSYWLHASREHCSIKSQFSRAMQFTLIIREIGRTSANITETLRQLSRASRGHVTWFSSSKACEGSNSHSLTLLTINPCLFDRAGSASNYFGFYRLMVRSRLNSYKKNDNMTHLCKFSINFHQAKAHSQLCG